MATPSAAGVSCPQCGRRYRWKPELAGRKLLCACGLKMRLPAEPGGAPVAVAGTETPRAAATEPDPLGTYALDLAAALPVMAAAPATPAPAGPQCPSCGRTLRAGASICIPCGIRIPSGRPIITAEQSNLNEAYARVEKALWWVSWIVGLGMIPFASEAHGAKRPHFIRLIAIITVLASAWFWSYEWTGSPRMMHLKNAMLWAGDAEPDSYHIQLMYENTSYGDTDAFLEKADELSGEVDPTVLSLAAVRALSPAQQCFGQFHAWQLVTHAFLHADLLHLAGNLLFLFIIGSRVNALIGNLGALVLYPLLGVVAALVQMPSMADQVPTPMLGASGAIMGLAGMYFVFFPVNRIHVAAWARLIFTLFRLKLKLFQCRGFWVLLFYIGFDVLYLSLPLESSTAHWAHLGGFLAGMVIAIALLVSRAVNARGGDLLSVALGRGAWPILGRPAQWQAPGREQGWLQRLYIVPPRAIARLRAMARPA